MYLSYKYLNKKTANIVIVICLVIQLIDFYPAMSNKFNYEEKNYDIDTSWQELLEETEHIVYLSFGQTSFDEMRTAYYKIAYIAKENNCTLNNFYFAREIENVQETSMKYIEKLQHGETEKGYIYVIKQASDNKWWNQSLNVNSLDGYTVIIPNNNVKK